MESPQKTPECVWIMYMVKEKSWGQSTRQIEQEKLAYCMEKKLSKIFTPYPKINFWWIKYLYKKKKIIK